MQDKDFNSTDYPYNLLTAIVGTVWTSELPSDFNQSIEYVLAGLSERECEVLHKYFREGKTLREAGKIFGVTYARIEQIKDRALRKLRHPARLNYLKYGVKGMENRAVQQALNNEYSAALTNIATVSKKLSILARKRLTEEALRDISETTKEIELSTPIEDLDFSVRTFNCLRRAGILTVGELTKLDNEEIYKIRNLGKRALDEICCKLDEYGIEYNFAEDCETASSELFE